MKGWTTEKWIKCICMFYKIASAQSYFKISVFVYLCFCLGRYRVSCVQITVIRLLVCVFVSDLIAHATASLLTSSKMFLICKKAHLSRNKNVFLPSTQTTLNPLCPWNMQKKCNSEEVAFAQKRKTTTTLLWGSRCILKRIANDLTCQAEELLSWRARNRN